MIQDILGMENEFPDLKVIINLSDIQIDHPFVLPWNKVMDIGYSETDCKILKQRHKLMAVNECACLTYTSGTTGMPKGSS